MSTPPKWELDILAAEDTPTDIELLQMALARCGSVRSLHIVRDGRELVAYLKGEAPFTDPGRQAPNVVLMDLKMPRMDGMDVLQWLRNNPQCSVIPVVILSSSALDQDVLKAYHLGVNAYFQKPTKFQELQDILESILNFWAHAKRPPVTQFPC